MFQNLTHKQIASISLLTLLGCTGVGWLTTTTIIPQIVLAITPEVNLSISRQGQETYENFLLRAEAMAKVATQNSFTKNPSIAEIRVVIIGQNQGSLAPILSLKVSRDRWRTEPNVQRWATYFPDSRLLLGFQQPTATPQLQPKPEPTPTESPSPEPEATPEAPLSPSGLEGYFPPDPEPTPERRPVDRLRNQG